MGCKFDCFPPFIIHRLIFSHGELGQGPYVKQFQNGFIEIEMLSEQAPSGIKAIGAGGFHSMVLTNSGDLYAFGKNDKGCLGPGIEDGSVFDPYPVELYKNVKHFKIGLFANYIFYGNFFRLTGSNFLIKCNFR